MSTSASPRKLLLIGWDGADWKIVAELMAAGRMPHLERLVDGGVMGNLATLHPVLSPILWTSIATGKRAHKHGIHGFAEPDGAGGVRPITNLGRRTKAIWNILSQQGLRCNVVGWWPSHPAEPIRGAMVSNRFQVALAPGDQPWPLRPGTLHPPHLAAELGALRIHPQEIVGEQLLPFVPQAARVDQSTDVRLFHVAKTLAEAATVQAAGTALMQRGPWDFTAMYFDAIDHFCHAFMRYRAPRLDRVSAEDFELYRHVIDTAYQFHDVMLGAAVAQAGPETTVMLLSDHGFHADHLRPRVVSNEPAGPADEHRAFGMLVINGPGIERDGLIFGASLLDITPTILTLFDLPIGRDMDGRPLLAAWARPPVPAMIDSWDAVPGEAGRHPPDVQVDPIDAQESLTQLVELGYIDAPDADAALATRHTIRELRYNLARDLFGAQLFGEAMHDFAGLWDEFPDEGRFGVKVIETALALGDHVAARAALDRLVLEKQRYAGEARTALAAAATRLKDTDPTTVSRLERDQLTRMRARANVNPAAFAYLTGRVLHAEGRHREALEELAAAESAQETNLPSVHQATGACLLALRRLDAAEAQYQRSLEIEPLDAAALLGLARCQLERRRPEAALEAVTQSLRLIHAAPQAHLVYGLALAALRRSDEAIRALEEAVAQDPNATDAHRALARLHRAAGRGDRAREHVQLAVDARRRRAEQRMAPSAAARPVDTADDAAAMAVAAGLGDLSDAAAIRAAADEPPVVIVSGLPRSGTSMMMQMLAAGGMPILRDDSRPADADNPRGYYELDVVRRLAQEHDWVADARGKALKVVAQLLPHLPMKHRYLVVFMVRPLGEVIASQRAMLTRLGRAGASVSDVALAAIYRKQLASVRSILGRHPDRVAALAVYYDEALTHPTATAQRLAAFVGGGLDTSAMSAAVAPDLRRQASGRPAS